MLDLASIRRTTWASISQFEGETLDGRPVYVRYKWGELAVWLGQPGSSHGLEGEPIVRRDYGHRHNFDIVWNEVEALTGIRSLGRIEDKFR